MSSIIKLLQNDTLRPSWNEFFMANALLFAKRSPCTRLHVGCVLVKDNHVISSGYNGFLAGAPHKSHIRNEHEQNTVHAEANCIADCAKRGISTINAVAYITHFPCLNCLKLLLTAGITKIIYLNNYNNDELVYEMVNNRNIPLYQMEELGDVVINIPKSEKTSVQITREQLELPRTPIEHKDGYPFGF